jgi:hypothetical protein
VRSRLLVGLGAALCLLSATVVVSTVPAGVAAAGALITGKQVKNSSLTGKDIKDGSLTSKEFRPGQLPSGPQGPAGAPGTPGTPGTTGPRGFSAWDTIPSGTTVSGPFGYDSTSGTAHVDDYVTITLPGTAPAHLGNTKVNFDNDASPVTNDDDATCTGSFSSPTAPAGKVCLYVIETGGLATAQGLSDDNNVDSALESRGFAIEVSTDADNADIYIKGAWAYTAP